MTITKKQGLTKNKQVRKMVKNTKNNIESLSDNITCDELFACKINVKSAVEEGKNNRLRGELRLFRRFMWQFDEKWIIIEK